jgi:hypothetical protein
MGSPDVSRDSDARPAPPSGGFDAGLALASLYDRLNKLESRSAAPSAAPKKAFYESQLFSTVLSGVLLALFGFFLTGRLSQSAKEREINTTNAAQMQNLLVKISTGTAQEAEAAAISLTTFGQYSIPPLIANLQYGPERALAAERGLMALALTESTPVCDNHRKVLDNRTRRYTAQSHTVVIRIMGAASCRSAMPTLQRYDSLLARADADTIAFAQYQQMVRDATPSNVTTSREELKSTLELLDDR